MPSLDIPTSNDESIYSSIRKLDDDEEENPDPCEPTNPDEPDDLKKVTKNLNADGTYELAVTCKHRTMHEDMYRTTYVFIGVMFFMIFIGLICCCLAYKSCWQNTYSFYQNLRDSCKKKEKKKPENEEEG